MKNSQETIKVAGPGMKVLPVGENGDAEEQNLPPQLIVPAARGAENHGANLNFAPGHDDHLTVTDTAPVLTAVDLPLLGDSRMRALDRTHDMMALHTMRLVESKSDSLSVIIKPAVGTELSLELRQRGDSVEAQATLVRGDHQFLSGHWTELQQRLEQRGIKLAPLEGEGAFLADGNSEFRNGQFQQPESSQEEQAQQASAFAEFAATGPAGGAAARLATVHDGWESWA